MTKSSKNGLPPKPRLVYGHHCTSELLDEPRWHACVPGSDLLWMVQGGWTCPIEFFQIVPHPENDAVACRAIARAAARANDQ